jgi:YrbI family 3-deoxy-D-manno-octulosonate 8-phosphate phosphatase
MAAPGRLALPLCGCDAQAVPELGGNKTPSRPDPCPSRYIEAQAVPELGGKKKPPAPGPFPSHCPDILEMKLEQRIARIQTILCDVDGVLTDGGISFDNQGIEIKTFHVRDGIAIRIWQSMGGRFGLLTARTSHIVKVRAAELGVELVRQGFTDKLAVARQIMTEYQIQPSTVCYVGDDLPDLQLMGNVGLAVSVADGVPEVRAAAHHVTKAAGGQGAIRELIEFILKTQNRWDEIIRKYQAT